MPRIRPTTLGAGNEQPTNGGGIINYAATPSTVPLVGELVVAAAYTPPTVPGDGFTTPPYVKRCPAAGSFAGIGVCVGGSSLGSKPVAGGICMVGGRPGHGVLQGPRRRR